MQAAKGGKNQKRQREEFNDLMDAGMGYDDTDPFVDNSECVSESVPSITLSILYKIGLGDFMNMWGKYAFSC